MQRFRSLSVGIITVAVVECSSPTQPQIDKLKTVPYTALITAGTAALRSAAQELGRPALTWEVIADDKYVMREFCDWADSIPLVAPSVGILWIGHNGSTVAGDVAGIKSAFPTGFELAPQLSSASAAR